MRYSSQAVAAFTFLAIPVLSGCDITNLIGQQEASRHDEYTMPVPASGRCVVETRNGQIKCVASDVTEITIEATFKAKAITPEDAQRDVDSMSVRRSDKDGVARIIAVVPKGVNGQVSLTLTVPIQSDLELETTNGGIVVEDIRGSVEAESTNGGLTVSGSALSDVEMETTNGGLHLQGQLLPGRHELETVNGAIRVELTGPSVTLEASTRNGRVTANGSKIRRGEIITLGSDAQHAAAIHLNAETVNGGITVQHLKQAEGDAGSVTAPQIEGAEDETDEQAEADDDDDDEED